MVQRRTEAAVKYRDGQFILLAVFAAEARDLTRAGFRAYALQLRRDDGTVIEGDLWIQDEPRISDYLNAAVLLFDDQPGSLNW